MLRASNFSIFKLGQDFPKVKIRIILKLQMYFLLPPLPLTKSFEI